MTTRMTVHHVKKITKKTNDQLSTGGAWLEIQATDENGYITEITFFADDIKSLEILEKITAL